MTTEAAIRLLPGNDRCVDCKAIYPQWSAVSFGILVCLSCAGKHRSLGVSVSFVKSLGMDSWSQSELRQIEVGGNAKWVAVCAGTSTSDLPLEEKYTSGVAKAYKNRISLVASDPSASSSLTATEFLSMLARASTTSTGSTDDSTTLPSTPEIAVLPVLPLSPPQAPEIIDQKDSSPSSVDSIIPAPVNPDVLSVKCTTCRFSVPLEHLDSHSKECVVSAATGVVWRKYERHLGVPGLPLGISLTKTAGGFAEITRVAPGGEAERLNVLVGSYVVGLNAVKTSAFEEIVELVRTLPRPILFRFVCRPSSTSSSTAMASTSVTIRAGVPRTISSVPEPISIDLEITFDEKELGCSLQVRDFVCVVQQVDKGGPAHRRGVLVGSRIVEVNGREFLKPEDVIQAIKTSRRPMRVRFHRVEGLMRGWNRR
ncbi:hypothetical protein Gpo141_00000776 [Globisporangium polare]